jgi:hypothetical protein
MKRGTPLAPEENPTVRLLTDRLANEDLMFGSLVFLPKRPPLASDFALDVVFNEVANSLAGHADEVRQGHALPKNMRVLFPFGSVPCLATPCTGPTRSRATGARRHHIPIRGQLFTR